MGATIVPFQCISPRITNLDRTVAEETRLMSLICLTGPGANNSKSVQ